MNSSQMEKKKQFSTIPSIDSNTALIITTIIPNNKIKPAKVFIINIIKLKILITFFLLLL